MASSSTSSILSFLAPANPPRVEFTPNESLQAQFEEDAEMIEVTGHFHESLFPRIGRFTIGNLKHADISELEIPAKIVQIGHRIFRCAYVNLRDDNQMSLYGKRMSWGSCARAFLATFPHRYKPVPYNTYRQATLPDGTPAIHPNGTAIMEPVQIMVDQPVTRTDAEYAKIARRVFRALSVQNPERLMGVDSYENAYGERKIAGVYLNLGEIELDIESDDEDTSFPWIEADIPEELANEYFGDYDEIPDFPFETHVDEVSKAASAELSSDSRAIFTPSPGINPDDLDAIQRELENEVQEAISTEREPARKSSSPKQWPKVKTESYTRVRSPLSAPMARRSFIPVKSSIGSPGNWRTVESTPGFRSRS